MELIKEIPLSCVSVIDIEKCAFDSEDKDEWPAGRSLKQITILINLRLCCAFRLHRYLKGGCDTVLVFLMQRMGTLNYSATRRGKCKICIERSLLPELKGRDAYPQDW